jgi:tetratricopeptide (TPR) repeat protein
MHINIVGKSDLRTKGPTRQKALLAALLILVGLATAGTHWPALSARALSFDDDQYLTDNSLVQNVSLTSAWRFLTEVLEPSTVRGYYQPLTMISLMTDCALGGRPDNLMPFHRTSLILHIANTAMVIVLLCLLFGRVWIAAGVGLLFGVHPMTVETIPWVSERKTLLAAFFALLSLIFYVSYVRKDKGKFYVGSLAAYTVALMSKPTSLPLPVLMLLIDFWPLGRLDWRAVLRKLPFFIIGGIFAVITYASQSRTSLTLLPSQRSVVRILLILCHNIVFYFCKIVRPTNLSSHYPFPEPLALSNSVMLVGLVGTCVLIILLMISLRWTRGPLTGFLFFFAAILPTMQIIGFSNVIAADKFAYLPSFGLLMVLVPFTNWLVGSANISKKGIQRIAIAAAILTLAVCEARATRQNLAYWRDTVSLNKHMLVVTPDAAPVLTNMGVALASQERYDEAIAYYRLALKNSPNFIFAHSYLGGALASQDKFDEAISHYRQALQIKSHYKALKCSNLNNLGRALESQGKPDEAISYYRQALQIRPDSIETLSNLGIALAKQNDTREAIQYFVAALRTNPNDADTYLNLGKALAQQGRIAEAVEHYNEALRLKPDDVNAHNALGLALVGLGELGNAIIVYRKGLEFGPENAPLHSNLGIALIGQGQLDEAIGEFQTALQLQPDSQTHSNLGVALTLKGNFDGAIEQYAEAIQLEPDNAQIHFLLANALHARGNLAQSVTEYRKTLQLNPQHERAKRGLALAKGADPNQLYESSPPP